MKKEISDLKTSQFHDFAVHGKMRKEPMFRITPRQVYIYLRSHDQAVTGKNQYMYSTAFYYH